MQNSLSALLKKWLMKRQTFFLFFILVFFAFLTSQCGRGCNDGGRLSFQKSLSFQDKSSRKLGVGKWRKDYVKTICEDCSYGDYDQDISERTFDFYRPKGVEPSQKLPLIVFIHSGAFAWGDKEGTVISQYYRDFCRTGEFAVASVNYRLIPRVAAVLNFPRFKAFCAQEIYAAVGDVKASIRHLVDHADEYGIDTANVFVVGFSAGGIIASELVFTTYHEANQFVRSLNGSDNVDSQMEDDVAPLLRGVVSIGGAAMNGAHVEDEEALNMPMLFIHGSADSIVPYYEGRPFEKYVNGKIKLSLPTFFFELGLEEERDGIRKKRNKHGRGSGGVEFDASWALRFIRNGLTFDLCGPACISSRLGRMPQLHILTIEEAPHNFMQNEEGRFTRSYVDSREYMYRFFKHYMKARKPE